jgi:hypothetical protein
MDPRKYFHVPTEIILWTYSNNPWTDGNHSMNPWKSLEDNGNPGYWNYNLYGSDHFHRCIEFLRHFRTVEISSRYMQTLPWQTIIPWAFFAVYCAGCTSIALGVIGWRLMSPFPISKGYTINQPVFAWWNSCRAQVYYYICCTFRDQKVEIISRLVSTQAVFQDNGSW